MMKKVALLLNYQAIRVNISLIRNIQYKKCFYLQNRKFQKIPTETGETKTKKLPLQKRTVRN